MRDMYINEVKHQVYINAYIVRGPLICRRVTRLLMDPSSYQSPSIQPDFTGYNVYLQLLSPDSSQSQTVFVTEIVILVL